MIYLGVDVGGTKTDIGLFVGEQLLAGTRFETPQHYDSFLATLPEKSLPLLGNRSAKDLGAIGIGLPGVVDRTSGVLKGVAPNLSEWVGKTIAKDISETFDGVTTIAENDANLAGLAEARALDPKKYPRIMYLTVSTGIGAGIIVDGKIDVTLQDCEPGEIMVPHEGGYKTWEDIASARVLGELFGAKLGNILRGETRWTELVAPRLGIGIIACCATYNPLDAIVMGGGGGQHLEKFRTPLEDFLQNNMPNLDIPPLFGPNHPQDAVLVGAQIHLENSLPTK